MQKVLIDDNEQDQEGNKYHLYIYYYEPGDADLISPEEIISNADKIKLELQVGNQVVVPGHELVRIRVAPNGTETVDGFFRLSPDQTYALFKHWQRLDDIVRV